MPIDAAATRERLREFATEETASGATKGYRDNDLRTRPVRQRPAMQAPPVASDPAFNDHAEPVDGGFTDLDATPLALSQDAEAATENTSSAPDTTPRPRDPEPVAQPSPETEALDPPAMRRIIFHATADPGTTPPFAKTQPNLGGVGLRCGLGRFTQASGDLGRLLTAMRDMDGDRFEAVFGATPDFPEASVEELLLVCTALVPAGVTGESAPNMAPVGGKPLWAPEWIARFKTAAEHPPFQDAQYFVAAQTALVPMLDFARNMGLATERGLVILTERAIQLGIADAKAFAATAAGPIGSEALKRAALVHVAGGSVDATLSDFQATHGLPDTSGRLDPDSHAALFAALREAGDAPIPLPSYEMMLDMLTTAAADGAMPGRVAAIRTNPDLSDTQIGDADPVME